jgi:LmbE family N-acetylglucosaminyl deacetylase
MRALCMVAHPDDCVIFAYSLIHHYPNLDWTICYLTYTEKDPRGEEIAKFWDKRNIRTEFLGNIDDWHDIEKVSCSFDTVQACVDIRERCGNHEIIVTHDANGDYGHVHHKFVHDSVPADHPHVIYFAPPRAGTHVYSLPVDAYSLDELPLHRDVVEPFHARGHTNTYIIRSSTYDLIEALI